MKNGTPPVRASTVATSDVDGSGPKGLGEQRRGLALGERLDRDLVQPALASQLAAQPAQRMPSRHLVAAVCPDDERSARFR